MSDRGTTNTNARGSAQERRVRKVWLLATFGDGYTAPCHYCGIEVCWFTITVDRVIPGVLGGTYRRNNIRPACMHCNSVEGTKLREQLKRERLVAA